MNNEHTTTIVGTILAAVALIIGHFFGLIGILTFFVILILIFNLNHLV